MSASTKIVQSRRDPGVPLERNDIPQFVEDSLLHDPRRLVRMIPPRELTSGWFWSGDTQEKVTLLVWSVGFWMNRFEKDTILRILPAILKDRLIERLFMLLHFPMAVGEHVGYFDTPYALSCIYRSLDGGTDLENRAWTVFADNWNFASYTLLGANGKKIWPDERHYDSIATLCRELAENPIAFSRVITDKDNHTISVLVSYWKTIQDVKTQRKIELSLLSLVASRRSEEVIRSLDSNPERQPHRQFIAALHDIFGNSPGPAVIERMRQTMLAGPGEEIGVITTGVFIHLISAGQANQLDADLAGQMKAEFSCLKALVYATGFWEEYFYNLTTEAMKQPDFQMLLINIRALVSLLSRVANIEKKWSKKVLVTWVESGFFDYFDAVASKLVEDGNHAALGSGVLLLDEIKDTTKASSSRAKRLMGDQMPRLRTFSSLAPHWISVATNPQSINGVCRPNLTTMNEHELAQMQFWASFLDLQLLFMQPNRCSLRGCRAKGTKACVGCGTKYCSLTCQSSDWREHRSICQLAPILHSMIKWYKANKPFGPSS